MALWYGYDYLVDGYYNDSSDNYIRNELYRVLIKALSDSVPDRKNYFDVPSSVVKVTVEKETYPVLLPSENTPDSMKITEYCKAGTEPTTKSTRYNKLDNITNLKSKVTDDLVTLTWSSSKEPEYNSFESWKKKNSVLYAQHIEERFAELQAENGSFGYEIVETNKKTGESKVIDFTTSTSYKIDRKEYDATYTVKTKYQNNDITKSNGISLDVDGIKKAININDYTVENNLTTKSLTITDSTISLSNVSDNIVVKDKKGNNITSDCTINTSCSLVSGKGSCSISNDTATFTDAGKYEISYTVLYEDTILPVSKSTINVTSNKVEPTTPEETKPSTDTNTTTSNTNE